MVSETPGHSPCYICKDEAPRKVNDLVRPSTYVCIWMGCRTHEEYRSRMWGASYRGKEGVCQRLEVWVCRGDSQRR